MIADISCYDRFGFSPTTLKYAANTEKCEVIDYVDFSVKI